MNPTLTLSCPPPLTLSRTASLALSLRLAVRLHVSLGLALVDRVRSRPLLSRDLPPRLAGGVWSAFPALAFARRALATATITTPLRSPPRHLPSHLHCLRPAVAQFFVGRAQAWPRAKHHVPVLRIQLCRQRSNAAGGGSGGGRGEQLRPRALFHAAPRAIPVHGARTKLPLGSHKCQVQIFGVSPAKLWPRCRFLVGSGGRGRASSRKSSSSSSSSSSRPCQCPGRRVLVCNAVSTVVVALVLARSGQ